MISFLLVLLAAAGVQDWTLDTSSLTGEAPINRARAYAADSTAVNDVVRATLDELNIPLELDDVEQGLYVTEWQPYKAKHFPGLPVPPTVTLEKLRLNLYVPQGVQPARIYISSANVLRDSESRERVESFDIGPVGSWLFDKIEQTLGLEGQPIPYDPADRLATFEELAPGSTTFCASLAPTHVEQVEEPERLHYQSPYYPTPARVERVSGHVILRTWIFEDGSVYAEEKPLKCHGHRSFIPSARHAVGTWQFRPAIFRSCPVTVGFETTVMFTIH